ncbi:MAG: MGDG synthase family glycosyltransferase [Trueperaceae bacterium]
MPRHLYPLNPGSPKRILLISASIGGGHVAAARALEATCIERGLEVKHIDLLDYIPLPLRLVYRQTYFDLVRTAPDFIDWLGKNLDKKPTEHKSRRERLRARISRLISYYLPRAIVEYQPDWIIHTHFIAPEILSTRGRRLKVPQAIVITDFSAHSLWLQPKIAHYFVASEEVKVHLQMSGVDSERISITGIPIDSRFAKLESKGEARAALGLPHSKDFLLFMASGLEEKTLVPLLRQLETMHYPLKAIVILGRSEELRTIAEREIAKRELHPATADVDIELLGFTKDIPRYMAAADLLLGKPGGLTTSEALAAGLPFAVVSPYPLQEEANTTFLLEHGAGFRVDPLTLFSYKLKAFFQDTSRREAMTQQAHTLAKPNAAGAILELILSIPYREP